MLFYDLHIHSCLSPCASDDMTPHNICAMAHIKGLDVISVTDHNTAGNLRAVSENARRYDVLFVPGIEINTREEVHLLVILILWKMLKAFQNTAIIIGRI